VDVARNAPGTSVLGIRTAMAGRDGRTSSLGISEQLATAFEVLRQYREALQDGSTEINKKERPGHNGENPSAKV
jgi:hypothetical protein